MSDNLQSYFVKLGFLTDQASFAKFQQTLRDAERMVAQHTGGIAKNFLTWQAEITGAFAAVGASALGLVDKVAQADLNYQLFAMRMYMTKNQARELKIATDALGHSLEDIAWNPELRERLNILTADQQRMAQQLGPDYEMQMRRIRDIRFQFTRMKVEAQYAAFEVVDDFMRALGTGPGDLLKKLEKFNLWIQNNLPHLSQEFVHWFMPIWKDIKDVMGDTESAFKEAGIAFANVVGVLSWDSSLQGTAFSFDKIAKSVQKVVHWLAVMSETITDSEKILLHLFDAIALGIHGNFSGAALELRRSVDLITGKTGTILGAVAASTSAGEMIGGALGIEGGPLTMAAGAALGGAIGYGIHKLAPNGKSISISDFIARQAASFGIDPRLALAVARQESGMRQFDRAGNVVRSSAGALGMFQLMPATAKAFGLDPSDLEQNVYGGTELLQQLLRRYHGNTADALAAYNWNPAGVDKVLAGKATLPAETRNYVASVMASMGQSGSVNIGPITVNVGRTNANPHEIAQAVSDKIKSDAQKRTQRNLKEFQSTGWGYSTSG